MLTYDPANTSGFFFDPLVMAGAESLQPAPPPPPSDVVPGDVARYEVRVADLPEGAGGLLIAGQPTITVTVSTIAPREQLDVRLFDVKPDGAASLVTRGTYTLDSGSALPLGAKRVTITSYGNVWQADPADVLRLEVSNVDSPYLEPSRVPSVTWLGAVELAIPVRR